jgi:epoxide hydrolase-like protein
VNKPGSSTGAIYARRAQADGVTAAQIRRATRQASPKRLHSPPRSARSHSTLLRRTSSSCVRASRLRAGRIGSPSMINPRACGWRRSTHSRATRRESTTRAKVSARLNALPQFATEIDGTRIYFIHVRSRNADALPRIVTHRWHGSTSTRRSNRQPAAIRSLSRRATLLQAAGLLLCTTRAATRRGRTAGIQPPNIHAKRGNCVRRRARLAFPMQRLRRYRSGLRK